MRGLSILVLEKMYCALCGVEIVNNTEWKKNHLEYHSNKANKKEKWLTGLPKLKTRVK